MLRGCRCRARGCSFDQVHDGFTGGRRIGVAGFIGRRHARGVQQRQTNCLGHAGHSVGGELASAGTGCRASDALQYFKRGLRHAAVLVVTHGFENVLHSQIAAGEIGRHIGPFRDFARQDRPTVEEHGRHVQPQHRHHHARQRFVTARKTDNRIVAVTAHCQLYRVGNRFARR